jgi:hypothetical protein
MSRDIVYSMLSWRVFVNDMQSFRNFLNKRNSFSRKDSHSKKQNSELKKMIVPGSLFFRTIGKRVTFIRDDKENQSGLQVI